MVHKPGFFGIKKDSEEGGVEVKKKEISTEDLDIPIFLRKREKK